MNEKESYINKYNKKEIKESTLVSIIPAIVVLIWNYFDYGEINLFFIAISTGAFFLMFFGLAGYQEIILRPKKIEITSEGLILYQRLKPSPTCIQWAQIITVGVVLDDGQRNKEYPFDGNIYFKVNNKIKRYIINRTIIMQIRDKYHDVTGRYPPRGNPEQMIFDN